MALGGGGPSPLGGNFFGGLTGSVPGLDMLKGFVGGLVSTTGELKKFAVAGTVASAAVKAIQLESNIGSLKRYTNELSRGSESSKEFVKTTNEMAMATGIAADKIRELVVETSKNLFMTDLNNKQLTKYVETKLKFTKLTGLEGKLIDDVTSEYKAFLGVNEKNAKEMQGMIDLGKGVAETLFDLQKAAGVTADDVKEFGSNSAKGMAMLEMSAFMSGKSYGDLQKTFGKESNKILETNAAMYKALSAKGLGSYAKSASAILAGSFEDALEKLMPLGASMDDIAKAMATQDLPAIVNMQTKGVLDLLAKIPEGMDVAKQQLMIGQIAGIAQLPVQQVAKLAGQFAKYGRDTTRTMEEINKQSEKTAKMDASWREFGGSINHLLDRMREAGQALLSGLGKPIVEIIRGPLEAFTNSVTFLVGLFQKLPAPIQQAATAVLVLGSAIYVASGVFGAIAVSIAAVVAGLSLLYKIGDDDESRKWLTEKWPAAGAAAKSVADTVNASWKLLATGGKAVAAGMDAAFSVDKPSLENLTKLTDPKKLMKTDEWKAMTPKDQERITQEWKEAVAKIAPQYQKDMEAWEKAQAEKKQIWDNYVKDITAQYPSIGKAFDSIKASFTSMGDSFKGIFESIGKIGSKVWDMLSSWFEPTAEFFGTAFSVASDLVAKALGAIGSIIESFRPGIEALLDIFGELGTELLKIGKDLLPPLGAAFGVLIDVVKVTFQVLGSLFSGAMVIAGPVISFLIKGLGLLVRAFTWLFDLLGTPVLKIVGGVLSTLGTIVSGIISGISSVVGGIVSLITSPFETAYNILTKKTPFKWFFGESPSPLGMAIVDGIGAVGKTVVESLTWPFSTAADGVKTLWRTRIWELAKWTVKTPFKIIGSVAKKFDIVGKLMGPLARVGSFLSSTLAKPLLSLGLSLFESLTTALAPLGGWILKALAGPFSLLGGLLMKALAPIMPFLTTVGQTLMYALAPIGAAVLKMGGSVLNKLSAKGGMIGGAADWAKNKIGMTPSMATPAARQASAAMADVEFATGRSGRAGSTKPTGPLTTSAARDAEIARQTASGNVGYSTGRSGRSVPVAPGPLTTGPIVAPSPANVLGPQGGGRFGKAMGAVKGFGGKLAGGGGKLGGLLSLIGLGLGGASLASGISGGVTGSTGTEKVASGLSTAQAGVGVTEVAGGLVKGGGEAAGGLAKGGGMFARGLGAAGRVAGKVAAPLGMAVEGVSGYAEGQERGRGTAGSLARGGAKAAGAGLGALKGAAIGATIGTAIPIVGTAVGGIVGAIVGGLGGGMLGGFVDDVLFGDDPKSWGGIINAKIKGAASYVKNAFSSGKAAKTILSGGGIAGGAGLGFIFGGPIGALVGGYLGGYVGGFVNDLIYGDDPTTVGGWLNSKMKVAMPFIKQGLKTGWKLFTKYTPQGIAISYMGKAWDGIKNWWSGSKPGEGMSGAIESTWEDIKKGAEIGWELIKKYTPVGPMVDKLKELYDRGVKWWKESGIGKKIADTANTFVDEAGNFFSFIGNDIKDVGGAIADKAKEAGNWISKKGGEAWAWVKKEVDAEDWAKAAVDSAKISKEQNDKAKAVMEAKQKAVEEQKKGADMARNPNPAIQDGLDKSMKGYEEAAKSGQISGDKLKEIQEAMKKGAGGYEQMAAQINQDKNMTDEQKKAALAQIKSGTGGATAPGIMKEDASYTEINKRITPTTPADVQRWAALANPQPGVTGPAAPGALVSKSTEVAAQTVSSVTAQTVKAQPAMPAAQITPVANVTTATGPGIGGQTTATGQAMQAGIIPGQRGEDAAIQQVDLLKQILAALLGQKGGASATPSGTGGAPYGTTSGVYHPMSVPNRSTGSEFATSTVADLDGLGVMGG
jgi:hypothetical protein